MGGGIASKSSKKDYVHESCYWHGRVQKAEAKT